MTIAVLCLQLMQTKVAAPQPFPFGPDPFGPDY
jgi:hypothetical protein